MARKTYTIIVATILLAIIIFLGFEVERIYNQRKINQAEALFRQKLAIPSQEKVAVCNYQKNWQVVSALNNLWLINGERIYKTDISNRKDDYYPDIPTQPPTSPLIDYYHLYQSCLW